MKFSIIIPTLNNEKEICNLLDCLIAQTDKNFEVIISDGGSTDHTKDFVKGYERLLNIKFIESSSPEISARRNFGVKNSSSNYLIFFEPDVKIENRFIEKIKKYLSSNKVDVLTSWFIPKSGNALEKTVFKVLNIYLDTLRLFYPKGIGAFLYIKKERLLKAGGFSENMQIYEETTLAERLYKEGCRFKLLQSPFLDIYADTPTKSSRFYDAANLFKSQEYWLLSNPEIKENTPRKRLEKSISFSVLVPTLNEEKYIGILLNSLVNQTFKNFEVIIADAGSRDKTKEEVLKFSDKLNITFKIAPKKGVSAQRNYAASLAKNEHFIFFDADVKPEKKFIEKIARYLATHKVDTLTSWNLPMSDKWSDEFIYLLNNILILEATKNVSPCAVGTFIYVNKTAFNAVNGFDEEVSLAEDFDLVKRIFDKGFRFSLLRNPKIEVSVRRFDKEGRLNFIKRTIKSGYYYVLGGAKKCSSKVSQPSGEF